MRVIEHSYFTPTFLSLIGLARTININWFNQLLEVSWSTDWVIQIAIQSNCHKTQKDKSFLDCEQLFLFSQNIGVTAATHYNLGQIIPIPETEPLLQDKHAN